MIKKFLKAYAEAIACGMDVELSKEELDKVVSLAEQDEELFEFIDSKVMEHIEEVKDID